MFKVEHTNNYFLYQYLIQICKAFDTFLWNHCFRLEYFQINLFSFLNLTKFVCLFAY